ncbi:MAG: acyl carrier protein [Rhodospirillaceae bacterium]|nr:acyl carrier protein [Rhodospirillales bacterium]
MTIESRLIQVFRDSLELPPDCEIPGLAYRAVPEWDSVGHMRLVAALETEFDLMLETEQIIDLSSFSKALEILAAHGVQTV